MNQVSLLRVCTCDKNEGYSWPEFHAWYRLDADMHRCMTALREWIIDVKSSIELPSEATMQLAGRDFAFFLLQFVGLWSRRVYNYGNKNCAGITPWRLPTACDTAVWQWMYRLPPRRPNACPLRKRPLLLNQCGRASNSWDHLIYHMWSHQSACERYLAELELLMRRFFRLMRSVFFN